MITSIHSLLLASTLALSPYPAKCEGLGLHLASIHVPNHGYNNANLGVYYVSPSNYVLGSYYNSEYRWSTYAGKVLPLSDNCSIMVGGITGYSKPVLPLVSLNYNLGNGYSISIPVYKTFVVNIRRDL